MISKKHATENQALIFIFWSGRAHRIRFYRSVKIGVSHGDAILTHIYKPCASIVYCADWRELKMSDPLDKNIELVIFDCDGVLIDSEIISARMLQAELRLLNVDITLDHIIENYIGRSYPTVLSEIQTSFDVTLPHDFGDHYRERLLAAFERDLKVMPHVEEVIACLNVPYCVATSSSPKRVSSSLKTVGLSPYFDQNIFTASEVKHGKPAPDLFLHAATKMGVAPQNCLVIEDSLTGVKAGLAAEMNVFRFTGGSHLAYSSLCKALGGALEIFDSFTKFFELCPDLKLKAPHAEKRI